MNSSTFISVFLGTRMIYVIHVYINKHPPILDMHSPIFFHSDFYLAPINLNSHDVMI